MTFRSLAIACALFAVVATAGSAAAAPAEALPQATDVRVGGDDKQTRFVIDLSQKIDLAAFTLADPYRVVIDLPQVAFQLPAKAGEKGRGLIKAFRYGLIMQGGSRIVLDTKGPVRVEQGFHAGRRRRPAGASGARSRPRPIARAFLRTIALENRRARSAAGKPRDAAAESPGDTRPLIVLDPGHGGIDTGAKAAGGELEKDVVLQFALTLRDRIERQRQIPRGDDARRRHFRPARRSGCGSRARAGRRAVHLDPRRRASRAAKAQAEGATVYTLSENASDAEAARLAEAENKADVIAGVDLTAEPDDVANILVDLAQRETKNFSAQFARRWSANSRRPPGCTSIR